MAFIGWLLHLVLWLYSLVIIIEVILNWMVILGVANIKNRKAQNLVDWLKRLTHPAYSKVRPYIPPIAGMDLTPLVVLVGIWMLQWVIAYTFY